MSVTSGQSVTVTFTTRHPVTGMGTDADFAPSGIVNVNGLANAATVTVTNLGTGEYKAAVTLPSLSIGDGVDLRISATVGGVADKAIVWRERCDATVNSRSTYAGGAVASITDVSNIVAGGPIVVVNNMVQSDVQMVLQSADAALGLQMAGDKFKADEEFDTNVTSMAANTLTASAVASDAVAEIQSGLMTSASYTAPLSAAGTRTALGMSSANLDTQLSAIVADTNELQTDWANGGRLDLILDAATASASTAATNAINANTNTGTIITNLAVVDDNVDAIKVKSDQLYFSGSAGSTRVLADANVTLDQTDLDYLLAGGIATEAGQQKILKRLGEG